MSQSYQEAFTKVYHALMGQGCQSRVPGLFDDEDGTDCTYRGESGTKCAIGHLISDEQMEKYNIKEGTNPYSFGIELIEEILSCETQPRHLRFEAPERFLCALQGAHDEANPDDFKKSFRVNMQKIAEQYKLEMPS